MSVSALLRGTYDHLLDETSLQKEHLGIHENGQPIPGFSKYYVSIHLTSWSAGTPPVATGLYEKYNLACTVTKRAVTPQDTLMSLMFIEELEGIEKIIREIIRSIDNNYVLLRRMNNFLHIDRSWIVEPLAWSGTSLPEIVNGDWMFAEPTDPRTGLVMTVNFTGCGRDQEYQNVE